MTVIVARKKATGIIAAVLIVLIVSIMGVVVASLLGTDTGSTLNYLHSQQALFIAEGGLEYYLKQLQKETRSWKTYTPPQPTNEALGNGTFTISTANAKKDEIDVTSEAHVLGMDGQTVKRVVSVHATRGTGIPEAFKYVQHSGSNISFMGSTGKVKGDLSTTGEVTYEEGMTIKGTITEHSSVPVPVVDFASYEAIADHKETNFFFKKNQTYDGIWYITQSASFEDGVTLNGTIIADVINITNCSNVTVKPSGNYPALVASSAIIIGLGGAKNIDISGLVYAGGLIKVWAMEKATFTGALISGMYIETMYANNIDFNYDSKIFTNPPPYFSGGGVNVATSNWNEIY